MTALAARHRFGVRGARASRGVVMRPARVAALAVAVVVLVGFAVVPTAWGSWTTTSNAGGAGVAQGGSVNAGSVPSAVAYGNSVVVTWPASTLADGAAVSGYIVKRYSTTMVVQTALTNCSGTISNLGCIENDVPAGTWTYTVTPVFGVHWTGSESASSTPVVTGTTEPTNTVWMWVTP